MAILKGRFVGETLYSEGLLMQEIAHRSVSEGNPDQVILLEHPNVYTLGRRGDHQDILVQCFIHLGQQTNRSLDR